jgi:hypothetical protein
MIVRNVIDVRSDLGFEALSVMKLAVFNGLTDRTINKASPSA